jgi:hypothetical protein
VRTRGRPGSGSLGWPLATEAGLQWYVLENLKVVTEYSRREFTNDESTPTHERVVDNFFSARVAFGF